MKAKISGFAHGPGLIAGDGKMTLQALLIFVWEFREFGLKFVAQATFILCRPAENRPGDIIVFADLMVRIVALNAGVKTLPRSCFLTGVASFGDLIGHIIMAGRALVRLKKIQ